MMGGKARKYGKVEKTHEFEIDEVQAMFSDIDFRSGDVRWSEDYRQEDMLQVVYPNNYVLDMGWYDAISRYVIYIVKDFEWGVPVVKYSAETEDDIKVLLQKAIEKVDYESNNGKSYYGGLWKTEIIER